MKIEKHPHAEALIFDLDGTLSDSIPLHLYTWKLVCQHYNCHFDENIITEITGMPTIRFAERVIAENNLQGIDPQELVDRKQQSFWDRANLLRPIKPVVDLVYQYHGKIPISIGTGASRKSTETQLHVLGLRKYFDIIVSADEVTKHKPEPETFLKCAELMNIAPKKCQVLEDGILGMQAAKAAGMYLTDVRSFLDN